MFNIDTSSVNVAPATYTVSYYDSYDETTKTYGTHIVNKDTKVAEDSSLSSISGASLPTSADFSVPSGKFIDKWYYIPSDTGIATEFTTATKITADTKVYATYVNGHTVTFNSNYPSGTQTTKDVTVSRKQVLRLLNHKNQQLVVRDLILKHRQDIHLRAGLHKQTVAMKSYLMMVQILHLQLTFQQSAMYMLNGHRA